jgi:hypothetical protein
MHGYIPEQFTILVTGDSSSFDLSNGLVVAKILSEFKEASLLSQYFYIVLKDCSFAAFFS